MPEQDSTELSSKLAAVLTGQEEILAAYLFGSQAEGVAHERSDVDVALLLTPNTDPSSALDIRLATATALARASGRSVDVVILNRAPPLLRFQVIRRGRLLVDRDTTARCLFEARSMSEYYDAKRYLDDQLSHLMHRVREEGLGAGYQGHRNTLEEARRLSKRLAALSASDT